jgi:glucokinase
MAVVGVHLGATNVVTLAFDGTRDPAGSIRLKTPQRGDRREVVDVLEAGVRSAVDDAGLALADLEVIGVGTPGVVMGATVGGASNVAGWSERFSLGDMLQDRLDIPVRVVNDVTAAAVGEHREGAGRGSDDVLVVFVGTGVGAGLILDGTPYFGVHGGAGEFGHMVVELDGVECPCGRRGCVEAYAGRRALADAVEAAVARGEETVLPDLMKERGKSRLGSGVFRAALDAGDRLTVHLLERAIGALGAGIASAVNLLDVDHVVVGGGLADKLGDWFHFRLEAAMRPHLFLQPPTVRLARAELGYEAGARGAALLAAESG